MMTSLTWLQLFLMVSGAQMLPAATSEEGNSRVQLRSHSATWKEDSLRFEVEVANGLSEAVSSMEIGVVYAASGKALKGWRRSSSIRRGGASFRGRGWWLFESG